MSLTKQEFTQYVKEFQFKDLFIALGWNRDKGSPSVVSIGKESFKVTPVAEKQAFRILLCAPQTDGRIPDYAMRKQIHTHVAKLYQEHFIIYTDARQHEQLWQVPVRRSGQPLRIVETRWNKTQEPEFLYQRAVGLFIALDEEGKITIVDIRQRVAANFEQNAERVTKRFYDGFKREHTAFLKFIKGIEGQVNQDWYASLMLNRLMFCYFIQKKGFLNGELDYLKGRLTRCQEKRGENQFYTFYRDFLIVLFHQGLGAPGRDSALVDEIGAVPYLNGGFFDKHQLEEEYPNIQIDDKAFEGLFTFFDQWNWHLDDRTQADGKQINPDVIGYIFERYINDRAGMGAYYTKEDITDYIGKNCLIPYLFDETRRRYPGAFTNAFDQLKQSGNTYIYEAVKHGIEHDLPDHITAGLDPDQTDLLDKRSGWNRPAPAEVALPTEIWREVIDRRKRYTDIMSRLADGSVTTINDFITYNLNIRVYAQEVLEDTVNPKLILHFYRSLESVSVLDPTCGSGAFLFAALNILEPLYETCLMRMQTFVEEEDRLNTTDRQTFRNSFDEFRKILSYVRNSQHPNLRYFIYKSIILNNLYGVDIMREATEIAKLRLFLKLVATVDPDYDAPNMGLEPLPDVDFNIRAGNTLIGFATEKELEKGLSYTLEGSLAKPGIDEKMEMVAMAFDRYKHIQLTHGQDDYDDLRKAKTDLRTRLKDLNESLNKLLHRQHASLKYEAWCSSYKPFHWLAEFYEIIKGSGGFDVIIGNPPYVEYAKVKKTYTLNDYYSLECGNLFAIVSDRSLSLRNEKGYFSFIVPISAVCTQRMEKLQKLLTTVGDLWLSNYAERPSKLFSGAEVLLTIFITGPKQAHPNIQTTGFIKWKSEQREHLFNTLSYSKIISKTKPYVFPKLCHINENVILLKLKKNAFLGSNMSKSNIKDKIYYRIGGGRYWKVFTSFQPKFVLNGADGVSSRESYLFFLSDQDKKAGIAVLSSSLFYWYYILTTNCRDLNPADLREFNFDLAALESTKKAKLVLLAEELMRDYQSNSKMKDKISSQTGNLIYQEFYPRLSKPIIDEIDKVLAEHYGFTNEELDFIVNYDIKYRMGREAEEGDE